MRRPSADAAAIAALRGRLSEDERADTRRRVGRVRSGPDRQIVLAGVQRPRRRARIDAGGDDGVGRTGGVAVGRYGPEDLAAVVRDSRRIGRCSGIEPKPDAAVAVTVLDGRVRAEPRVGTADRHGHGFSVLCRHVERDHVARVLRDDGRPEVRGLCVGIDDADPIGFGCRVGGGIGRGDRVVARPGGREQVGLEFDCGVTVAAERAITPLHDGALGVLERHLDLPAAVGRGDSGVDPVGGRHVPVVGTDRQPQIAERHVGRGGDAPVVSHRFDGVLPAPVSRVGVEHEHLASGPGPPGEDDRPRTVRHVERPVRLLGDERHGLGLVGVGVDVLCRCRVGRCHLDTAGFEGLGVRGIVHGVDRDGD